MAILNRDTSKPKVPVPVKQTDSAVTEPPHFQGMTVDTRYTDRRSLITHIEGSSWVVCYFSQILGKDNEPTPLEIGKNAVYQQYTQIDNLEIKVTSTLNSTQRPEGKSFDVVGSAIVYPPLIPNTGDVFLADVGDGTEAVFSITGTNRLTYLKDSVFEIEYVLRSYSTEEYRNDLANKVVKQVRFLKELLDHGKDPLLVEQDYHQMLDAGASEQQLLGHYFATFYQKNIGSLAVPDQTYETFDPFLTKALSMFMDTDEHPLIRSLKQYSVELPGRDTPKTLWDALVNLSMDTLPLCNEKLALVDARCFSTFPQYHGVAFSQIDDVVYPADKDKRDLLSRDLSPGKFDARDIRHQFETTRLGNLAQLTKPKGNGIEALYSIHPITKDDYYIFSEAFYFHDYKNQSQLETITRHVMEGKPVNREILAKLCEHSPRWGRLERFYYTPILLLLLKLVRQGG